MRKFLFAGVAAVSLAAVAAAPGQAKASWLSEWLHQRFDPDYYGYTDYSPGYGYYAPTYYYTPGYYYTPYRSYYYAPGYYNYGWSRYPRGWYGWHDHHGRGWHEGHHGHGWHDGHGHHHHH